MGGWCLRMTCVSPPELYELLNEHVGSSDFRRDVHVALDCCFSAIPLAHLLCNFRESNRLRIMDGFAAAFHDEYAWEVDNLHHGAFTFSKAYPGNAHVDQAVLARAVRQNDESYLRYAL